MLIGGGESDDPVADVVGRRAPPCRPTTSSPSCSRRPTLIVTPSAAGGGFTVSYEMPEFATEVEVQVVGGADDGAGGERFVGTGEPIEVPSTEPSAVRRRPLDERLRPGVHRRRAGLLRLTGETSRSLA